MTQHVRQTTPLMRFALLLGAILTFSAGTQLYVLTDVTDRFFAWTIGAGSAATIIGAFYWTATVLSFLSWRERVWAMARVGVPGVTLFLWATLFTTLVHLDKFHFSGPWTGQVAAWAWLVIYIVDPILVTVALVLQHRVAGVDPERLAILPRAYQLALAVFGAAAGLLGLVMIATPSLVVGVASFPLTALTARTIGGWVLAMGGVFLTMAWENDRDRVRPAAIAAVAAPILLAIGTIRYWDQFTWGTTGWIYAAVLAVIGLLGILGLIPGKRDSGSAPS